MSVQGTLGRGTIKIGRWDYPAARLSGGTIIRCTKRDPDKGEWFDATEAEAAKYVETVSVAPDPPEQPKTSRWQVGGTCPKGHEFATEEDIYTMPSGRKQCRKCRKGYASKA